MPSEKQLKYQKALEYEIFIKEGYSFSKEKIIHANTIFDIWWHIGLFSSWCRKYNHNAQIYFFEPVASNYNQAYDNLKDVPNIHLYNFWIARESKKWTILVNDTKSMQSSKYESFLNTKWEPEQVEFITLSDAINKTWADTIDLLKMDIEWMEFEVLNNLTDDIWNKINSLVLEVHLLNDELKKWWEELLNNLKKCFDKVNIIPSGYNDKIFLVYAVK